MTAQRILYIDPDNSSLTEECYAPVLRDDGFYVQTVVDLDEALAIIRDPEALRATDLVICAMEISCHSRFNLAECSNGYETGLRMRDIIRAHNQDIPLLLFSVVLFGADPRTRAMLDDAGYRFAEDPHTACIRKIDTPPSDLSAHVRELLSSRAA